MSVALSFKEYYRHNKNWWFEFLGDAILISLLSPETAIIRQYLEMMPRMSRRVDHVQKEFAEDFTVVNGNLLLCKVR